MYDVIVVGARVAGSSTALQFARAGYRVLMVDRARFPSDKLSTLYVHQPGVDRLARWGVLDTVVATGCPALDRAVYQVADVRLTGCSLPAGDQRAAYAPRRHLLDKILIDAAVAAGVEFREGTSVSGVVFDGDRATGVEFRGGSSREHAHLVVGADGMRSATAKHLGAPHVVQDPLGTCAYYSYWTGLPADFELYERPGNWIGVVPTNDATLIASYSPQADFDAVRADPQAHYLESIRTTAPALYERAMAGEQVDRMHGSGDQQNFFRQASGPGWALVGDAAHHKDSITARGINDAFWQAELLTTAVGDALHDPAALDKRLAAYADDLLDGLFECYRNTLVVAQLEVTEHKLTMLRAVAQSPSLTDRYFATASGVLSVEEFDDDELDEALSA
ncbi:NAD(P)/FAD-dependent oxidoreductase [Lentzea sp.]|uniref:NAD(P)/FAD-dependent oxidoreductase n=1 Tax=Lentzea sp. TaxID=56099 RepID=UPI002D179E1F|nr:NAD(P)/FAD-dependent oxidoreductase [Lentzea sp.]HUQ60536.1 NAD(P)/FAD-dependent oxidoreductase [Lentzea sp.]